MKLYIYCSRLTFPGRSGICQVRSTSDKVTSESLIIAFMSAPSISRQMSSGNKHGAVVNKRKKQPKGTNIPKELEAQPSKFSGHLLLPRRTALPFVEEEIRKLGGHASPRQMEAIVRKVMDTFQVSRQMATLRLKDFGYDVAKGVNRYVDYIIEHKTVFEQYMDDPQFRDVIDTGRFLFVENHLCLVP